MLLIIIFLLCIIHHSCILVSQRINICLCWPSILHVFYFITSLIFIIFLCLIFIFLHFNNLLGYILQPLIFCLAPLLVCMCVCACVRVCMCMWLYCVFTALNMSDKFCFITFLLFSTKYSFLLWFALWTVSLHFNWVVLHHHIMSTVSSNMYFPSFLFYLAKCLLQTV